MKTKTLIILAIIGLVVLKCKEGTVGEVVSSPEVALNETPYTIDYGTFSTPNFHGNELTDEGVRLGRMLFYEKRMSRDNSIA